MTSLLRYEATEYTHFSVRLTVYTGALLKWVGYGSCVGSVNYFVRGESGWGWLLFLSCSISLYRIAHWIGGMPLVPSSLMSLFDPRRTSSQTFFERQVIKVVNRYAPGIEKQGKQCAEVCAKGIANLEQLGAKELNLTAVDGTVLHAMYVAPSKHVKHADASVFSPSQPPMVMIVLNANGEFFEHDGLYNEHSDALRYGQRGFHVILMNYRGVGKSGLGGWTSRTGLLLDADAAVQFALYVLKAPEHRIFFKTRSLGGAVGTEAASFRPKLNVCNARSFSTFSAAARGVIGPKFGKYAAWAVSFLFWDYDSVRNWKLVGGFKWVEYIPQDTMLCPESILYYALSEDDSIDTRSLNVLKMRTTVGDTHNRPLYEFEYSERWSFFEKAFKHIQAIEKK